MCPLTGLGRETLRFATSLEKLYLIKVLKNVADIYHSMVPKRRIAQPNRGIESLRYPENQMCSGSTQPVVGIPERLWHES